MFEFVHIYPILADIFKFKNTPTYLEGKSFKEVLKNPELPFRNVVHAVAKRGNFLGRMVKPTNRDMWNGMMLGKELYNQINDK